MCEDSVDYQTIFAREEGSVAAPTAGLHFSDTMVEALHSRGVTLHRVTLHVGAGTFLPVKAEDTSGHRMQPEWGDLSAETAAALNDARRSGGAARRGWFDRVAAAGKRGRGKRLARGIFR